VFRRLLRLQGLFYFTFSEKSDVWAYGVLVWEILTCCRIFPYDEHHDDIALVSLIEGGLRLPCPDDVPAAVYALLMDCWNIEPDERPTFAAIVARIPMLISAVLSTIGFDL
jgi:serine/threonine protein kinase